MTTFTAATPYHSVLLDDYIFGADSAGGVSAGVKSQVMRTYMSENSQPVNVNLTALAGLAITDGNFIVGNGASWVAESGATARASLGLGTIATIDDAPSDGEIYGRQNAAWIRVGSNVGVFAYLSASADTTITTAGTYYPILGTFTNNPLEGFAAATAFPPGIKYVEAETEYFKILWAASISADSASTTVSFGVKKNNVLETGSLMSTLCKTAGELYAISGIYVVELATNDEVQLVVTTDGNGDVITVDNYTTAITHFFDLL